MFKNSYFFILFCALFILGGAPCASTSDSQTHQNDPQGLAPEDHGDLGSSEGGSHSLKGQGPAEPKNEGPARDEVPPEHAENDQGDKSPRPEPEEEADPLPQILMKKWNVSLIFTLNGCKLQPGIDITKDTTATFSKNGFVIRTYLGKKGVSSFEFFAEPLEDGLVKLSKGKSIKQKMVNGIYRGPSEEKSLADFQLRYEVGGSSIHRGKQELRLDFLNGNSICEGEGHLSFIEADLPRIIKR